MQNYCHTSILKQHWFQFLFIVKAATLKQQISKFYLQIQCTEAIYISQWHITNLNARFCALNLWLLRVDISLAQV